jgi:dihydroxyacetone kinase-like protein
VGTILKAVGMTLLSSVGGASGPLYGTFFLRGGMAAGKEELSDEDLVPCSRVLSTACPGAGRAQPGDKTMVDALLPAMAALKGRRRRRKRHVSARWKTPQPPPQGHESIPSRCVARKGRASYLGERSIGHQDPGATSSYLILNALPQR